jgi:hypothetical protein
MKNVLAALAFAWILAGCLSSSEEPEPLFASDEVEASSDEFLWEVVELAVAKLDFPRKLNEELRHLVLETGWKTDLMPFRGLGSRRAAVVKLASLEQGRWRIEVRVKHQVNDTLKRPLDSSQADWKWASDDLAMAQILLQHVRGFLNGTIEPSPERDDPLDAWRRTELEAEKP